ncbi:MAG: tetratricopeptide repeat protein, partial [Promicromonosporaceae bacterium]|nr:tetratricopeptide repeat protein [Promicromonosporaceae bacterium]
MTVSGALRQGGSGLMLIGTSLGRWLVAMTAALLAAGVALIGIGVANNNEAIRVVGFAVVGVAVLVGVVGEIISQRRAHVRKGTGSFGVPAVSDVSFVGYESQRRTVTDALRKKGKDRKVVLITGGGGAGKSRLARQCARRHDKVLWLKNASSEENINKTLVDWAEEQGLAEGSPARQLAKAREQLRKGRYVVVLDNVDPPELRRGDTESDNTMSEVAAAANFIAGFDRGRFLVTSRSEGGWRIADLVSVKLEKLDPDDGVALLGLAAGQGKNHYARDEAARKLVAELGGLPLAIRQVGAYLAFGTETTPKEFLEGAWKATARDETMNHNYAGEEANRTIARVWDSTIQAQKPFAQEVLRVLAWLAADDIPRELLDGLAGGQDRVSLVDALKDLANFNLIDLGANGQTISIHRLVQLVARTPATEDQHHYRDQADITAAGEKALKLLDAALPIAESGPAGLLASRSILPSAIAFSGASTEFPLDLLPSEALKDSLAVRHWLASFLDDHARWEAAIQLLEPVLEARKRVLGKDHPDTLDSANNLAICYQGLGGEENLQKAIKLHKETHEARKRVLGKDHPDTLNSANNLANCYQDLGGEENLQKAIVLHEETHATFKRVLPE